MRACVIALLVICSYRVGCGEGAGLQPATCGEEDGGAVDSGAPVDAGSDAGGDDGDDAGADAGVDAGTGGGAPDAGDAGPLPSGDGGVTVLSSTAIAVGGTTYVELEVDWVRRLAYLGSRRSGVCVDVVDFADAGSPALIGTIGSSTFHGCLGVALIDDGTKLLLSANGTSRLQAWTLGPDPRAVGGWAMLHDVTLPALGKRFARVQPIDAGVWDVVGATRFSIIRHTFALDAGFAWAAQFTAPAGMEFNDATLLAGFVVAQSYLGNTEPIFRLDPVTLALLQAVPTAHWNWASTTNAAGTVAFFAGAPGFASATYDPDGGLHVSEYSHAAVNPNTYRDAVFGPGAANPLVYALYSTCQLDVLDLSAPANPVLLRSGRLPAGSFVGECYGIELSPTEDLGLIATNGGRLVAFVPSSVPPASFSYPPVGAP